MKQGNPRYCDACKEWECNKHEPFREESTAELEADWKRRGYIVD